MKIQKLLNTAMLGAFFLLMMTVSAGEEVALRVYSAKKCREVCSLTSNCAHYSYQEKSSYCSLKQASGWTAYESYGTTSGNRDGTKIRENTYYSDGGVYWVNQNQESGLYPRNHSEGCRKICHEMKYCHYYTYCQGVCYLKKKRGWTKKSDYRCVSGDYLGESFLEDIAYVGGDTY